jgi:ACS family D-galactonate transporter-like MFS transporter
MTRNAQDALALPSSPPGAGDSDLAASLAAIAARSHPDEAATRRRYMVLLLLFLGVALNYLDRTNLAIAAPVMQKEMGISPVMMGLMFSAFSWFYMAMQVPSGIVLDRFGVRRTFGWAVFLWSACTCLFGFAGSAGQVAALRGTLGTVEAPCFPAAQRAVSNWFPRRERGRAVCTYISGEYIGLAFLTPVLTLAVVHWGWPSIFIAAGLLGLVYSAVFLSLYREPTESRSINQAEIDLLREGGATYAEAVRSQPFEWAALGKLLIKRELWGVYLTKFLFSSSHAFYFTWFPHYLVVEKHMSLTRAGLSAMVPFAVSMLGMLLSGVFSDWMSRHVGNHTLARKLPVVVGMLLCACILSANFTDDPTLVVVVMSIAFFGQGVAGSVDALCCDVAPAEKFGTTIGLFQLFSNLGGATAPLIIGFILQATGTYNGAMFYIASVAVLSVVSILFVIGRVERVTL